MFSSVSFFFVYLAFIGIADLIRNKDDYLINYSTKNVYKPLSVSPQPTLTSNKVLQR